MSEKNLSPARSSEWALAVQHRLLAWGRTHFEAYPWRAAGIARWQALVAEFLLLRTRAKQVGPVFESIRQTFPDAAAFGTADDASLRSLIAPLGLRWREPLFVALAREIGVCDGDLPRTAKELRALPGVGEYVAAATAALHSGERAVIVDSNVVRMLCRLLGVPYNGETRRKRWLRVLADRLTPEVGFKEYGYAALDLSMTVCRPRDPLCEDCPLLSLCATGSGYQDPASGSAESLSTR